MNSPAIASPTSATKRYVRPSSCPRDTGSKPPVSEAAGSNTPCPLVEPVRSAGNIYGTRTTALRTCAVKGNAVAGCKLRPGPCMNWSEPTKRLLFGPQEGMRDPKVVKSSRPRPWPCINWSQATKRSLFGPQQGRHTPKLQNPKERCRTQTIRHRCMF